MPNILLTRIDNRLIHGQVGMTWVNWLGANLVLVADDELANDQVQQHLMDIALPDAVESRYFTLQKTIDVIHKAADRQKIFLVCRTPQSVLKLVEGGVPISAVNVGNMHFAEGKRQVDKTVSVDDDDVRCFHALVEKGVPCIVQKTPDDVKKDVLSLL